MVLNNPFNRASDPLNHDIFERFFSHIDIVKKRKEFVEGVTKEVLESINEKLTEMTPDLMTDFNCIYQELTRMMKDFQKTINAIENKTKKLIESSSLTQDVYSIRDEMKVIKKKLDKLNSGLKGFSRLSEVISEEEK